MALVLVLSSERGRVFLDEDSVLAALGLLGLRVVEPRGLCGLRLRDTGLILPVLLLIDIGESGGLALLLKPDIGGDPVVKPGPDVALMW